MPQLRIVIDILLCPQNRREANTRATKAARRKRYNANRKEREANEEEEQFLSEVADMDRFFKRGKKDQGKDEEDEEDYGAPINKL